MNKRFSFTIFFLIGVAVVSNIGANYWYRQAQKWEAIAESRKENRNPTRTWNIQNATTNELVIVEPAKATVPPNGHITLTVMVTNNPAEPAK